MALWLDLTPFLQFVQGYLIGPGFTWTSPLNNIVQIKQNFVFKMAAGVDGLQLALIIFGLIQRFQTPSNFELHEHYIYPVNLGFYACSSIQLFKSKDNGWLDIHWKNICPVDNSHNSLHFLCKRNPDHKLKNKGP
jgi:hypothetical protein